MITKCVCTWGWRELTCILKGRHRHVSAVLWGSQGSHPRVCNSKSSGLFHFYKWLFIILTWHLANEPQNPPIHCLAYSWQKEHERPMNLPPPPNPSTHHCTDENPDPQKEETVSFPLGQHLAHSLAYYTIINCLVNAWMNEQLHDLFKYLT